MGRCGVRCLVHRTKRYQRTAKSCGPGAATVASIHVALWWRGNGDKNRRSPGRVRISRKTIARGKPGCPGCTCSSTRVLFSTGLSHTGLRAQSAPGFPCALCQREGQRDCKTQAKSRRENESACLSTVIARSDSDDPSTLAAQATPGAASAEARRAKAQAKQSTYPCADR
jgi:hypothetical protein